MRPYNKDLVALAILKEQDEILRQFVCKAMDKKATTEHNILRGLREKLQKDFDAKVAEYIQKNPEDTCVKTIHLLIVCKNEYDDIYEAKHGDYCSNVLYDQFVAKYGETLVIEGEQQPEGIYLEVHPSELEIIKNHFEPMDEVQEIEQESMLNHEWREPTVFLYSERASKYLENHNVKIPFPYPEVIHPMFPEIQVEVGVHFVAIDNYGYNLAFWDVSEMQTIEDEALRVAKAIKLAYTNPQELLEMLEDKDKFSVKYPNSSKYW